jgi:hypothetical protein
MQAFLTIPKAVATGTGEWLSSELSPPSVRYQLLCICPHDRSAASPEIMGIGPSLMGTSPRPAAVSSRQLSRTACVHGLVPPGATVDECGPKSPDSHRVVWGLTSQPPGSRRACLRLPVCPPGSPVRPPFSGFPSSGVLRLAPFSRCRVPVPVGVPPGSLSPEQSSR